MFLWKEPGSSKLELRPPHQSWLGMGYPSPVLAREGAPQAYPVKNTPDLSWLGDTPVLFWPGGTLVLAGGIPGLRYLHWYWEYPPPNWDWFTMHLRLQYLDLGAHLLCIEVPPLGTVVPSRKDLRPETWERIWDWGTPRRDLGPLTRVPPRKNMKPVVGSIMGSGRTTYAGGNKH